MQRVMIVGQPGSGKSWLAVQVGQRLGLPVHHMDHIHWHPGWVERGIAEKARLCGQIEAEDTWVFEGNFSPTVANRVARADLVVWLDIPVALRLWRVLMRHLRYLGRGRPDMADGCPEQLRNLPDFLRYIWMTRASGRKRLAEQAALAGPKARRLTTKTQVAEFLAQLS